ncbi:MAG: ribosome maturation factor RimM, partial [Candidatus Zixiibacteriota bacterium]
VLDVLNLPANDVLVLNTKDGEVMIPFIKQIVKSVSIEEKVIVVNNIRDFIL